MVPRAPHPLPPPPLRPLPGGAGVAPPHLPMRRRRGQPFRPPRRRGRRPLPVLLPARPRRPHQQRRRSGEVESLSLFCWGGGLAGGWAVTCVGVGGRVGAAYALPRVFPEQFFFPCVRALLGLACLAASAVRLCLSFCYATVLLDEKLPSSLHWKSKCTLRLRLAHNLCCGSVLILAVALCRQPSASTDRFRRPTPHRRWRLRLWWRGGGWTWGHFAANGQAIPTVPPPPLAAQKRCNAPDGGSAATAARLRAGGGGVVPPAGGMPGGQSPPWLGRHPPRRHCLIRWGGAGTEASSAAI